jgi:hypothetical protein
MGRSGAAGGVLIFVGLLALAFVTAVALGLAIALAIWLTYQAIKWHRWRHAEPVPRHQVMRPMELPLVLQPGETALRAHLRATLYKEKLIRHYRSRRKGTAYGAAYRVARPLWFGLGAWAGQSEGTSWTERAFVGTRGCAILTERRLIFMDSASVHTIIPLGELVSVGVGSSGAWVKHYPLLLARTRGDKVQRFQLQLEEPSTAKRVVAEEWAREILTQVRPTAAALAPGHARRRG